MARSGRPPKYAWNEWLDGEPHTFCPVARFGVSPERVAARVRNYASQHRLKATIRINGPSWERDTTMTIRLTPRG